MRITSLPSLRLILRPYNSADLEPFVALNADENVRRHVGGTLSRDSATRLFERFITGECLPGNEVWAVLDKKSNDYIGHCWFAREGSDPPELGFLVAATHWGQGYGAEVAETILNYARCVAGYRRVIATVDTDNLASIRVLEAVGMKRENDCEDDEGVYYVYVVDFVCE